MSDKILPATEPATCEWCQRYVTRHMDAYYYGFTATGVRDVDNVLCSVASAGKACHHTEDWSEHGYPELIQKAADNTAATIHAKDALIAELVSALCGLVEINTKWNAMVERTIGRPPNWTDGYLDLARAVIAKAKEAGR